MGLGSGSGLGLATVSTRDHSEARVDAAAAEAEEGVLGGAAPSRAAHTLVGVRVRVRVGDRVRVRVGVGVRVRVRVGVRVERLGMELGGEVLRDRLGRGGEDAQVEEDLPGSG